MRIRDGSSVEGGVALLQPKGAAVQVHRLQECLTLHSDINLQVGALRQNGLLTCDDWLGLSDSILLRPDGLVNLLRLHEGLNGLAKIDVDVNIEIHTRQWGIGQNCVQLKAGTKQVRKVQHGLK